MQVAVGLPLILETPKLSPGILASSIRETPLRTTSYHEFDVMKRKIYNYTYEGLLSPMYPTALALLYVRHGATILVMDHISNQNQEQKVEYDADKMKEIATKAIFPASRELSILSLYQLLKFLAINSLSPQINSKIMKVVKFSACRKVLRVGRIRAATAIMSTWIRFRLPYQVSVWIVDTCIAAYRQTQEHDLQGQGTVVKRESVAISATRQAITLTGGLIGGAVVCGLTTMIMPKGASIGGLFGDAIGIELTKYLLNTYKILC